ncbi:MAG: hypothetical protein WCO16_01760, partial [bacterium]
MAKYRIRDMAEGSLVDHLLYHRGVKNKDAFLNPDYDKGIHDSYLMKDMEKVVLRVFEAVKNKEKICIYTDY